MKRIKFLLVSLWTITCPVLGIPQVAFNTDGTAAHPSAMLDIKSTSRGFLPPRMTTAQRDAIVTPAEALTIYNTDTRRVEFFNGSVWTVSPGEFICGQSQLMDIDGNLYGTVQIGTQCWTADNLNTGIRIDTAAVPHENGIIERFCFDNLEANCDVYGGLYTWNEMMQYVTDTINQGICPSGWRLPTTHDILTLLSSLETGQAGKALKEAGEQHWCDQNTGTNSSGFTAMGAGAIDYLGNSVDWHMWSHMWLTTNKGTGVQRWANRFDLSCPSPNAFIMSYWLGTYGFSVRCIKITAP